MRFGEKVRDLRKKHSLTQDELAKCLGVSKRTIIGWERDGRYPRNVEILEKMADIFHVPLTYIQPDQSLFIERAAATYGKKGKIEAQHLAFELTELFASGELTAQDMDGIMYQMTKRKMNAAQIATAKRIHINLVFHRRLQITEQVSLIHAVLQHLFEAVLYCCDILVIGHTVPCIVGFQNFHEHFSLLQQFTDKDRDQVFFL